MGNYLIMCLLLCFFNYLYNYKKKNILPTLLGSDAYPYLLVSIEE